MLLDKKGSSRSFQSSQYKRTKNFALRPLQAFGYCGGKTRLSAHIADLLDYAATTYCEPFGGSAAVLLNKPPHKYEIYADRSIALCCFWKCMANDEAAFELIGRLYDVDCDKESFDSFRAVVDAVEASGKTLSELSDGEVLDIAVACFLTYTASRNNAGQHFKNTRFSTNESYYKRVDGLPEVANRFCGVEVMHANALDLLSGSRFSGANTVCYLDPVYMKGSHNHTLYKYHFEYDDHIKLLEIIRGMNSQVIVSGYDDSTRLYDRYLLNGEGIDGGGFQAWQRCEVEVLSSVAHYSKERVEVFWFNRS
jgi:DNA adenine methylase